ncbi:MAG TPA: DUF808 family protein, partial [Methylophilaceae bacterium]|nr:DUF808 family protein [Methylophilaceae bacterium]
VEGLEKRAHKFLHGEAGDQSGHDATAAALNDPAIDLVAYEKEKVRGAIRTDFVLSAEIIVIALGSAKDAALATQATVVAGIAFVMTVGVYGVVAGIVKLDDLGLHLLRTGAENALSGLRRRIGSAILRAAPLLMKTLSVVGTAAMFMVGGGILLHGLPQAHDLLHHAEQAMHGIPAVGGALGAVSPALLGGLAGVLAGALVLGLVSIGTFFISKMRRA